MEVFLNDVQIKRTFFKKIYRAELNYFVHFESDQTRVVLEQPEMGNHLLPMGRLTTLLQVECQINFTVLVLTFMAINGLKPTYQWDSLFKYL